jgi:hypothetical protein
LKNEVSVQVNQFNFEVVQEAIEEIAARELESPLEKWFWHHDFVGVRSWDVFTLGPPPLENNSRMKEMVIHQLEDLFIIKRRKKRPRKLWELGQWL